MAAPLEKRQESIKLALTCIFFAIVFVCIYGRGYFTSSTTRNIVYLRVGTMTDTHNSRVNASKIYNVTSKQTTRKNYFMESIGELPSVSVSMMQRNEEYERRLPKALIIGVKKGGTKALLVFLRAHSKIRASNKEIHFFDNEENYLKGMNWYRKQMPKSFSRQITLEKSPRYFITGGVPKRVHQMSPDTKLILIFRNPVKRAISDYVHMKTRKKKHIIGDDIETVLWNNSTSTFNSNMPFIQNSLYSNHLKRWLKYFPMRQIHIVNGDDLIKHPGEEVIKVQKFLNLDVEITKQDFFFSKKKKFYCLKNRKLNQHITKDIICLGKSKGRTHPPVSQRTLEAMKKFYRPYNEQLYKITGIDFGW
ncbi:heparan sulfate glucosamine 3-O-sulfotransferase 5-like [Rhopilema esculentum]|uniref:heparan sulfate glucosamine 3-O-sulfotransferase 5-like n=1 Tax=Rhopilema esculentum TaxID=499914 RepID=UPI0031E19CCD|eukprot:gene9358-17061_t